MAQYWVYLNNEVVGPYAVEQLIRLRGFSRQTQIRVDDASGKTTDWMSPAEIPELAHIFKAADEHLASTPAPGPVKLPPKTALPRAGPRQAAPTVILRARARKSYTWVWLLLAAMLLAGGVFRWSQFALRGAQSREQEAARGLVENAQLPASSLYGTLRQYLQEKEIHPRWEFERSQEALYRVTLSWSGRDGSNVYAFEANTQAQTVRGLNTAAVKLLSEGFPPPPSAKAKAAAPEKKSPADSFQPALDSHREALEGGDFQTVWNGFSRRKKTEMAKAGMSQDGFLRLQNLTYHVDSAVKQTVVKTKKESDQEALVLIKQSQAGRPDIYVKQLWIYEDEEWKLDDEEKRAAPSPTPEADSSSAKPSPAKLPGMSN